MISIEEMEGLENTYAKEIERDFNTYLDALNNHKRRLPNGLWKTPWALASAKKITRYAVENIWKAKSLKEKQECLKREHLKEVKIDVMCLRLFGRSSYKLLLNAYPELDVTKLDRAPRNGWKDEEYIRKQVKANIEKHIGTDHNDITEQFNATFIKKYCTRRLLSDYTVYELLELAYPGEYYPWDLERVSKGFWEDEKNIKSAILYLYKKFDNDLDYFLSSVTSRLLKDLGLAGLYRSCEMSMSVLKQKIKEVVRESDVSSSN